MYCRLFIMFEGWIKISTAVTSTDLKPRSVVVPERHTRGWRRCDESETDSSICLGATLEVVSLTHGTTCIMGAKEVGGCF